MSRFLPRLLLTLLALSLGCLMGGAVGWRLAAPALGTWGGAMLGLLLRQWGDTRRAMRLVAWLRTDLGVVRPAIATSGASWLNALSEPSVSRQQHPEEAAADEALSLCHPQSPLTLPVLIRTCGTGQRLVLTQYVTERLRADKMGRDFVVNVSHEIRSPLTALADFVETLANLLLSEVERARVLTLMQQQAQRMQTLVADLLTLAQLKAAPNYRPTTGCQ